MPKIIKVKCNGPNHCVNEVDLEKVVNDGTVRGYRGPTASPRPKLLDRYALPCAHCAPGRVVLERQDIEKHLYGRSS